MILAVRAALPAAPTGDPPVVLVHGAANAASVWVFWQRALAAAGRAAYAIDLRGHGDSGPFDVAHTTMADYADDVAALLRDLGRPPVLLGWSMGALVAMLAAARGGVAGVVALAPSAPAAQRDPAAPLRPGTFGAEVYGITTSDPGAAQPAMPDLDREERAIALASLGRESTLARDERRAGIVIGSLACPLLIVTGTDDRQWPRARYDSLALRADHLAAEGASHWGLVLNRRALARLVPAVLDWLSAAR